METTGDFVHAAITFCDDRHEQQRFTQVRLGVQNQVDKRYPSD
jgi:hypothetical protein